MDENHYLLRLNGETHIENWHIRLDGHEFE